MQNLQSTREENGTEIEVAIYSIAGKKRYVERPQTQKIELQELL